MSSYTVSKLAQDAGVSVSASVVRDYVLRGLFRPAGHTEGGYGLYDARSLERLRLVRALFEAASAWAKWCGRVTRWTVRGPQLSRPQAALHRQIETGGGAEAEGNRQDRQCAADQRAGREQQRKPRQCGRVDKERCGPNEAMAAPTR